MTDPSGSDHKDETKKPSLKKKPTKIDLQKNIQLCLNFGFGTLITAKNEMDYRNAVISIHNGTELLMKYYLHKKDKLLIFHKINHHFLLKERDDLIKNVKSKKARSNTIPFSECLIILEYFSELPDRNRVYLNRLNDFRNNMVHYEYYYSQNKIWKLLISHIYQFINDLVSELELNLQDFLKERYIGSLDRFKKSIDDKIRDDYLRKIEAAKKHYFDELTAEERAQKEETKDYTRKKYDDIVTCPACKNPALLRKIKKSEIESFESHEIFKQNLILKELSCHYCGLNITDYDQLRLDFSDKEVNLPDVLIPQDCPDDCPEDCPEEDCPEEDCPDDCPEDCPEEDCPEEDCPEEDCPDDCPEDCPEEDCPDDCPEDCPKD